MRYRIGVLAVLAVTFLASCGAPSLANFAGFSIAKRDDASSFTLALNLGRTKRDPVPVLPAATAPEPIGRFTLVTYNVAGLPQVISPSSPRINVPLMSPLLNHYDVALVQEDFSYHRELALGTSHAYRSEPMRARSLVGDGLSVFSELPFDGVHHIRWERCHGFISGATDCLADKGFTMSELELAPGRSVHLYNLHADSGSGELDVEARADNFRQLARYIADHSREHAVIVAGDTNLRVTDAPGDERTLTTFIDSLQLRDSCRVCACPEELIDRVLYRAAPLLELSIARWWQDPRFIDGRGQALSDHSAVGVEVRWRALHDDQMVAQLSGDP
jgi:endonuclease/exonuclease/phosphatase family metal-dependent hydrolase